MLPVDSCCTLSSLHCNVTHTHSDTKTAAVIFSLLSERKWETKYTDTQFVLRRFIYPVTELENALTFSGRAN